MLVELKNPGEVINGQAVRAQGASAELDLGGSGIRSLEYWPAEKAFLIVSGPFNDDGAFRAVAVERRADRQADQTCRLAHIDGYTPEAVAFFGDAHNLWVLSDDGSRNVNGEDCKAGTEEVRHFRAGWIKLSE